MTRLLWTGTVFHTLSFGSSSFVEEEHQTWYFFVMTFHLVAMVMQVKGHVTTYWMKNHKNNKIFALAANSSNESVENYVKKVDFFEQEKTLNKNNGIESRPWGDVKGNRNKNFESQDEMYKSLHSCDKTVVQHSLFSLPWRYVLPWKQITGILAVMLLGQFLRAINQTGNKWLDTPDLADWLMM